MTTKISIPHRVTKAAIYTSELDDSYTLTSRAVQLGAAVVAAVAAGISLWYANLAAANLASAGRI